MAAQTVVTVVGNNVTLPCHVPVYPAWQGQSANGYIIYNNEGYTLFSNPKLGSKANRLSWGSDNASLVITSVIKAEDEGNYTCTRLNSMFVIQLSVKGKTLFLYNCTIMEAIFRFVNADDRAISILINGQAVEIQLLIRDKTF